MAIIGTVLEIQKYHERQATVEHPRKEIAVETDTSSGVTETLMIYDRETDQLVSNTSYDLDQSAMSKAETGGAKEVELAGRKAELAL